MFLTAPAWAGFYEGVAAYNRGDFATAIREWRPLAEQGNAKAQHNLGIMYRNGRGVAQDYAEAVMSSRKAAEHGNAKAQYNLGVMYGKGLGVPQDYAKALQWLRRAAAQGHPKAKDHVKALDAAGVTPLPPSSDLELAPDPGAPAGPRPPAGPGPKKIPASAPSGAPAPVPPEAGAFRIQLGSLDSTIAAEAEWRRLRRRHRDLLEALRHRVQRADLGAKGVFYRLQAGPLADAGRAKGLCETLARRNVRCLVITP